MGYQESFVYTNKKDIEKNNKDIKNILKLFKKYDIRLINDDSCNCIGVLRFNKDIGSRYPKGIEILIVVGERSEQRNSRFLFNICYDYKSDFTDEEFNEYIPSQYSHGCENSIKREDININIPRFTNKELDFIDSVKVVFIEDNGSVFDSENFNENTSFIKIDDYIKDNEI